MDEVSDVKSDDEVVVDVRDEVVEAIETVSISILAAMEGVNKQTN